jgi:hypothetical protein
VRLPGASVEAFAPACGGAGTALRVLSGGTLGGAVGTPSFTAKAAVDEAITSKAHSMCRFKDKSPSRKYRLMCAMAGDCVVSVRDHGFV